MKSRLILAATLAASVALPASATDLEVTHWWTSGGEAAAVAEFAKAFTAGGDTWVDGAIAGGGGTARPIIVSRIIGGEPMGATQLNHGRQAEELIEAGLMTDLTEVAEREGWKDFVNPSSLLDSCTVDGKIYCAPVNIHSWQWLWLSHAAYAEAGVDVPKNWDEFVASAPKLREKGIIPLAMGQQSWQATGAFGVAVVAIAGQEEWLKVTRDKDVDTVMGPAYTKVFEAWGAARELSEGSDVQDWNQATSLVITGKAGGQIMGDWAQGEFQVAGQVAGKDYSCLPGLGVNKVISTGGDAFYFPVVDDADIKAAQLRMASQLMSKEVQVAFNLKKGSLPIRGDIDLGTANDCMKQGLEILAGGNILPDGAQLMSADTQTQLEDLTVEFWNDKTITPVAFQEAYAEIIGDAD
ncbi:MAG: ABC transporter substrate-binding protein [Hyphomicrobiales bacterium]